MTKVLSDAILRLTDSAILPFDISRLVDVIKKSDVMLTDMEKTLHNRLGKDFGKTCFSFLLRLKNRINMTICKNKLIPCKISSSTLALGLYSVDNRGNYL